MNVFTEICTVHTTKNTYKCTVTASKKVPTNRQTREKLSSLTVVLMVVSDKLTSDKYKGPIRQMQNAGPGTIRQVRRIGRVFRQWHFKIYVYYL